MLKSKCNHYQVWNRLFKLAISDQRCDESTFDILCSFSTLACVDRVSNTIDEVGSAEDLYWKSDPDDILEDLYRGSGNILIHYISHTDNIQLDRIKYWIDKRKIDPSDAHHRCKTAFDYIAAKDVGLAEESHQRFGNIFYRSRISMKYLHLFKTPPSN